MSLPIAPTFGTFKIPEINNELMERAKLQTALNELKSQFPIEIPLLINGKEVDESIPRPQVRNNKTSDQRNPSDHQTIVAKYHEAEPSHIEDAIKGALETKSIWENYSIKDRCSIFLKAADLVSGKYRYKLMAATMLAEIDAAAELIDFWRFNAKFACEIYQEQPIKNSAGVWNRIEYRPLEGIVYAISPFNFTAIGGNLPSAPALMGNVVLWKPSPFAVLSNWIILQILREAGLPDGVIQFVPGPAEEITNQILKSPDFAALHFTGSTFVFKKLFKKIGNNIDIYKSYPRIVGETGGKNFHIIHKSADLNNAVQQTIRGAFEYQGQKCSACSRAYIPESLWEGFCSKLRDEHSRIKVGSVEASFAKIKDYIDHASNDSECEIIAGGKCDDSEGYFIPPTIIFTKNPKSKFMVEEIFGFASDRAAIVLGEHKLRNAAGNFYINDKSTGAVVGQQPFGGSRGSGTNDKAGSHTALYRFVSMRTIKENFINLEEFIYPSNLS
ncbi:7691_t:CDS:2 [Diversispora eburnea]|uniref:L-glutamate gamma-semialdehyde dehydrogenase n=1 Tax=Diversispora eburnea TaxID=1213867 RepID=A0A9N8VV20_9GLOM|nr:7691_t:CDS:2 [Diversispora eburnea]